MTLDDEDTKLELRGADNDAESDQDAVASAPSAVKRSALRDVLATLPLDDNPISQEEIERRFERLTQRERKVFACVLVEMTDKEMARQLGITPKTAEHYRRSVLDKMMATDARDLRRQVKNAF